MTKTIECQNLFPGCDAVLEADTEEELLQEAAAHAASAHGLREIDEETVDKVRALIIDK